MTKNPFRKNDVVRHKTLNLTGTVSDISNSGVSCWVKFEEFKGFHCYIHEELEFVSRPNNHSKAIAVLNKRSKNLSKSVYNLTFSEACNTYSKMDMIEYAISVLQDDST